MPAGLKVLLTPMMAFVPRHNKTFVMNLPARA
jgi:hypothetical protein